MKIKGVIKNLKLNKTLKIKKLISDNSKNTSRNFSGTVEGSVGSVVSDSSFFQLILFLKIYRPLPMYQC